VVRITKRIDTMVVFQNSQGLQTRGTLMHLDRHQVVFEVYNPYVVQLSEVLSEFKVLRGDRTVYSGRSVVSNLVSTGLVFIVTATLVDPWQNIAGLPAGSELSGEIADFVEGWEESHRLEQNYQLSVSTISYFLSELSRWLNQLEAESDIEPEPDAQREVIDTLLTGLTPKIHELFGKFEEVASAVPEEFVVPHRAFAQRELHPYMLVSPFVNRTFTKPLGYAGDYEMVNMILRDPLEGPNVYARIVNAFVLSREPAEAHRNRINFLVNMLREEAAAAGRESRRFRVLNVGCGPARETESFIREFAESELGEFTLLDFNEETLEYTGKRIAQARKDAGRNVEVTFVNKSIHDMLREFASTRHIDEARQRPEYDLVICAGLFDYLSDRICSRLLRLFYKWTKPGGRVGVTNVHLRNPIRQFMEHLVEWHLVYRDEAGFRGLVPEEWQPEISTDTTGVNVYMVVRKP
jgi:extracellular factor (EF) 3-hydroxypalmitic acid methyl ester biosynthesis protein